MTAVAVEILRLQCAWCRKILREGSDPTSKITSHGLCESCRETYFPERAERSGT
jgi:hypothetical protein